MTSKKLMIGIAIVGGAGLLLLSRPQTIYKGGGGGGATRVISGAFGDAPLTTGETKKGTSLPAPVINIYESGGGGFAIPKTSTKKDTTISAGGEGYTAPSTTWGLGSGGELIAGTEEDPIPSYKKEPSGVGFDFFDTISEKIGGWLGL